ncbi:hypothetical protein G9A89_014887 [Geosiphon pyriformis]|nr:hypothetical protein G9A89_014887 [Geosiphon pyriformis]
MERPISKIDNLPIEVNSIIMPIKVLVMEATQYQALVGNDWLFKTNMMLDWTTQELQISQNSQHMQAPAMCSYFKTTNVPALLIELEKKTAKKNCLLWELGLHQTKITRCELITIASLATANAMATQKDKTSGTINHVSLVANNCSMKEYEMIFLVEKERVTLCASIQSSLTIGNNNESIMSEYAHDTDAEFDLRYPEKDAIKLEPHLHICINLKIALEIPATTMIQLAFKSSLAKKGINIRGEIIDTGYICEYYILDNIQMRRMLSAPTRTIRTNELGKFRLTTIYATQDVTQ